MTLNPFLLPKITRPGLILALLAGAIIAFSPAEAGLQPDMNDKFLHGSAFFLLAMAAHFAYEKLGQTRLIRNLMIYGAAIEFIQFFIPYRSASLLDLLADFTGCLLYFLLLAPLILMAWPDRSVSD